MACRIQDAEMSRHGLSILHNIERLELRVSAALKVRVIPLESFDYFSLYVRILMQRHCNVHR